MAIRVKVRGVAQADRDGRAFDLPLLGDPGPGLLEYRVDGGTGSIHIQIEVAFHCRPSFLVGMVYSQDMRTFYRTM
jgi:hypothetical protein